MNSGGPLNESNNQLEENIGVVIVLSNKRTDVKKKQEVKNN